MRILKILVGCVVALGLSNAAIAKDDEDKEKDKDKPALSSRTFNAFQLRNIGPA